jgi:hypothetical protein
MPRAAPAFARLDSRLIRSRIAVAPVEIEADDALTLSGWQADLRLFLFAWLAGFVFFLAFLL